MATAFRSIAPIAHASPAVPTTANDNSAPSCWTQDRRAKLLLASCATNPPAGEWQRQTFGFSTDRWFAYVGYRAEALDAIRLEIGTRLSLNAQHNPDARPAFEAWCRQPNVLQAIDAALDATANGGA